MIRKIIFSCFLVVAFGISINEKDLLDCRQRADSDLICERKEQSNGYRREDKVESRRESNGAEFCRFRSRARLRTQDIDIVQGAEVETRLDRRIEVRAVTGYRPQGLLIAYNSLWFKQNLRVRRSENGEAEEIDSDTQPDPENDNLQTDVSKARAYVSMALLSLSEIDTNNAQVRNLSLRDGTLGEADNQQSMFSWKLDNVTSGDVFKTCDFEFSAEQLTTDSELSDLVVGAMFLKTSLVLEEDNITITPDTLESVFTIDNYPYRSQDNRLRLCTAIATGRRLRQGASEMTVDGADIIFQRFARYNMSRGDATVSQFEEMRCQDLGNGIVGQLRARYGASRMCFKACIDFAPGAQNIEYDPSMNVNTGEESNPEYAGAATLAFTSAVMIVLTQALM